MSNDPNSTLKADLIYAILTLDSYNRGYGSGISDLDETGPDARIGNFTIGEDVNQEDWESKGFYAISYKNNATGEIVIGRELTKVYESIRYGTMDEAIGLLASEPIKGEYVIAIEGKR